MLGDLDGQNMGHLEDQRKRCGQKDGSETNYEGLWNADQGMASVFHRYFGATAVWGQEMEQAVQ